MMCIMLNMVLQYGKWQKGECGTRYIYRHMVVVQLNTFSFSFYIKTPDGHIKVKNLIFGHIKYYLSTIPS